MARQASGPRRLLALVVAGAVVLILSTALRDCDWRRFPGLGAPAVSEAPGPLSPAKPAQSGDSRPFSGPGYVLDFADDFNPGLNALDDLGLSVLIAVDVSGSMLDPPASGGDPKYIQAERALLSIASFLEGLAARPSMRGMRLRVGLVRFHSEVQELFPLSDMDAQGFKRLKAAISAPGALSPGGKTAIGLALERGAEILASSGTIMKSLILLSDGENTSGEEPAQVLMAINQNRNDASTLDFPVLTRGTLVSVVGFDVDSGIYSPVAREGALVSAAADEEALVRALTEILVADISRLEAAP
jgi:hypothetical protein